MQQLTSFMTDGINNMSDRTYLISLSVLREIREPALSESRARDLTGSLRIDLNSELLVCNGSNLETMTVRLTCQI